MRGRPCKDKPHTPEEWCAMYSGPLTKAAVFFARTPEILLELSRLLDEGDLYERLGIDGWEKYFSSPPSWDSVVAYLYQQLSQNNDLSGLNVKAALRHPKNFRPAFLQDFKESFGPQLAGFLAGKISADDLRSKANDVMDMPHSFMAMNPDDIPNPAEIFLHPAIIFFLAISMPCWTYYQQTVEELLLEVKAGDYNALDKLLRLDKRFLENKVVRNAYYAVTSGKNETLKSDLKKTIDGKPRRDLTPQSLKYMIGGLMLEFTAQAKERMQEFMPIDLANAIAMTPPEKHDEVTQKITAMYMALTQPLTIQAVHELFDVIAMEDHGQPYDQDLPTDPAAFETAMRRYRKFWSDKTLIPSK